MTRAWLGSLIALTLFPLEALARPYVTLHDDGTFLAFRPTLTINEASDTLMRLYDQSGAARPDVISVWTAFDVGGEHDGTFFIPQANAIKGIGFDGVFGGDGTLQGRFGPVNAILLHNNVLALSQRASRNRASPDLTGFAQYIFLLEFSHQWLAAVRVPGGAPNELGAWPHWSFWLNSGDSPPGGNAWTDNGDGTFSTVPVNPGQVKYSDLDLYLMGLAGPSEVLGPIQVLENAVPPASPTDPLFGGPYASHSLTDFDAAPLTVTATSKAYTINDIITANGARDPATSPSTTTVGFVLLVSQDAGANEIAADQAVFDPIVPMLAPAFERATAGKATLSVITDDGTGLPDAGPDLDAGSEPVDGGIDAGPVIAPDGGVSAAHTGCSTSPGWGAPVAAFLSLLLVVGRRTRQRASSRAARTY